MRLWTFLIILFLATVAGIYIRQDPGYALFAYRDWTLEMPLWLSAVLLILLLALLLFILWSFNIFFGSGRRIKGWWFKNKQLSSRQNTARGLLELTKGSWSKAERYLRAGARFSDAPIINYLSAAKAAEESAAYDRRDRYLQLAYEVGGDSDVATRLTEAQLRFKQGEADQSIQTLKKLQKEQPKNPKILKLLSSLYEGSQNWQAIYDLLPVFRKANIFPVKESREAFELKVYQNLLPSKEKEGKTPLIKFWQALPSFAQNSKEAIAVYAEALMNVGAESEAETVLRNNLKKNWDTKLIHLYGKVKSTSPEKQLNFAETLLKQQGEDPSLLLTLGYLCFRNQLWGKAKDYLEKSISIQPSAEAYALLGQLMDRLGFPTKRDEYYRKGLFILVSSES